MGWKREDERGGDGRGRVKVGEWKREGKRERERWWKREDERERWVGGGGEDRGWKREGERERGVEEKG